PETSSPNAASRRRTRAGRQTRAAVRPASAGRAPAVRGAPTPRRGPPRPPSRGSSATGRLLVGEGAPDLLEDRLEQTEGGAAVLARELAGTRWATGREGAADRLMLALVREVELVDRLVAGSPDCRPRERAARALRNRLHVGEVGNPIDDVVEAVVRPHPLDG